MQRLLDRILEMRPGNVVELHDRFEISHESGEHSTLWKKLENFQVESELANLGDLYERYDGADLFSSTFKIASVNQPKLRNGVAITFDLDEIADELEAQNAEIPEGARPFMYQQGIGIYSISSTGDEIFEWDSEMHELGDIYNDLFSIFDEWLEAVG